MAGGERFRLRGEGGLRFCVFDNEVAIFNPVTWDTHIVDVSAAVILEALSKAPSSMACIEAMLVRHQGGGDAGPLSRALIDELCAAGLIEAEPVDASR